MRRPAEDKGILFHNRYLMPLGASWIFAVLATLDLYSPRRSHTLVVTRHLQAYEKTHFCGTFRVGWCGPVALVVVLPTNRLTDTGSNGRHLG